MWKRFWCDTFCPLGLHHTNVMFAQRKEDTENLFLIFNLKLSASPLLPAHV